MDDDIGKEQAGGDFPKVDRAKLTAAYKEERLKKGYATAGAFSDATGFERKTAYGMEDGSRDPTLITIEKFLSLTSKEHIAVFLARVDGALPKLLAAVNAAIKESSGKSAEVTTPVTERAHTASDIETPEIVPDAPVVAAESTRLHAQALAAEILIRVGYAITGAGEALGTDGTVRQSDAETPRRRRTDHVSR